MKNQVKYIVPNLLTKPYFNFAFHLTYDNYSKWHELRHGIQFA